MVKVKNKKNSFAADKSKNAAKKPNPFEIHINKQKFKVLGQKLKNDRGLPGISRTKAINKRKNTLLPEFNLKNKVNTFLDRRIGEKNKNMTPEDRIIARFTAERVKLHKKKSIFNLGDDEVLTHKGQTLNNVEKFDDPRSEDEFSDDDEKRNSGRLNAGFVEDAHFGGGVLSNTGKEGAKSRKDLIEQLITESKKRKAEKQKLREETIQLTEKLDTDWKDLLPLVNKTKAIPLEESNRPPIDDFDKTMRELRFEARGNPTDRLRNEDEIAKEEKERLDKLEQDRLARMKGFLNEKEARPKHRSADDLDDGFLIESDIDDPIENEETEIKNEDEESQSEDSENQSESDDEDGNSEDNLSDLKGDDTSGSESEEELTDNSTKNGIQIEDGIKNNQSIDSETCEDKPTQNEEKLSKMSRKIGKRVNESENTDSEDNESAEETIKSSKKHLKVEIKGKNNETESEDEDSKTESNKNSEKLSKNSYITKSVINNVGSNLEDSDSSENRTIELKKTNKKRTISISKDNAELKKPKLSTQPGSKTKENIIEDLLARKKIMEDARSELPYTFSIPDNYEKFEKTLSSQPVTAHQAIIVERMIKCSHPSLAEANKEKLSTLFAYLLQFINDLSSDVIKCFQFIDHIMPYLYDLAQTIPKDTHNAIIEVLKEKQLNYVNKKKKYPSLDTLVLFKIISLLFPTSDFRHQVVTPAFVFMDQLITRCKVKTRRDISSGLFLVTLALEYVTLSKRFLPSVINFLRGIFHSSIPKLTVRAIPVIPPFKRFESLLALSEKYKKPIELFMMGTDLVKTEIDDDFKVRTLFITLKLCSRFYTLLENLTSRVEIFEPILDVLQLIPIENYPMEIQDIHKQLLNEISSGKENRQMDYLVVAAQRPKALRLYEPKIQQVFENRKHRNLPKEKQERDKLIYKLKKEKKGALREIRRDNAFLSKLKIKKQLESDKERKDKVKEILSGASIQQGELNALDRKRKK